ncbi:FAD/NAD(P)-binding protein [Staphylococcus simulans]|uniref:FAD/NAD(P)-binding protein n=1 Tax=Staphylococcus simulans TaxID=1286 RepID=UPI0039998CEC
MRVAIIGMGTAGVSILRQLEQHSYFNELDIDVYDNAKNMGQGVPFQNDSSQLLINLPSKDMSLNSKDPEEFYRWYQQQNDFKFDNATYLPRFVFGHYMKSYLDQFNDKYDNIHIITEKATEMYLEKGFEKDSHIQYFICTNHEQEACRQYDYVFLTIGTMAYHDPYQLKGLKGFIKSPYPTYETLNTVEDTDDIAVIGTGLSSLDVIRYVVKHHPNLPLTAVSRRGALPSVRGEMPDITLKHLTKDNFNEIIKSHFGVVPLERAIQLFKQECEDLNIPLQQLINRKVGDPIKDLKYDLAHPEILGVFQSLLETIKENMNWIWNSLSIEDQRTFMKDYMPIMKANSNPMPPRTARLIIEEIEAGHLLIKSGLEKVTQENDAFIFKYKDSDASEQYNVVINATGPRTQLKDLDDDDAFLIDIANRQIVQAHPMGGIQIVPETNQVISPRYGTLPHLIAIGQITNGINQARNGVNMIVRQSVQAVKSLYEFHSENR